jgi:hypothetical protein
MNFVDEVYSLYKDQLCDDEDDAIAVVLSVLKDQSKDHVMQLISEMNDDEILQMMGVYLVEMIKIKMAQEGKLTQCKPVALQQYH